MQPMIDSDKNEIDIAFLYSDPLVRLEINNTLTQFINGLNQRKEFDQIVEELQKKHKKQKETKFYIKK